MVESVSVLLVSIAAVLTAIDQISIVLTTKKLWRQQQQLLQQLEMAKREDYFELSIAEPAGGTEGNVKNPFEGKEEKPKLTGKGAKKDEAESR